jgi:hypothetical protein
MSAGAPQAGAPPLVSRRAPRSRYAMGRQSMYIYFSSSVGQALQTSNTTTEFSLHLILEFVALWIN